MKTAGLSAAAAAVQARTDDAQAVQDRTGTTAVGPQPFRISLTVNDRMFEHEIEPTTTLMEFLRWHAGLTGTKEVCDRGACGGCSVLVDGRLINSCMMLAYDAVGRDITTVEGLARGGALDPLQESFIRHDALQCGYCTPGLIMAAKALLSDDPRPTFEQIRRGLSGNLCRCGTYNNVFNAVLEASGQTPIQDPE